MDMKGVKRPTGPSAIFALSSALGSPRTSPETDPVARIGSITRPYRAVIRNPDHWSVGQHRRRNPLPADGRGSLRCRPPFGSGREVGVGGAWPVDRRGRRRGDATVGGALGPRICTIHRRPSISRSGYARRWRVRGQWWPTSLRPAPAGARRRGPRPGHGRTAVDGSFTRWPMGERAPPG